MRKIFKGVTVLVIKRGDPNNYCYLSPRSLEKTLFHFCGIWVSIWTEHNKGIVEFSDWAKNRFVDMFGPAVEFDRKIIITPKHRFRLPFKPWLLNPKYSWRETDNKQVLLDVNSQKYVGYSHRTAMLFGLGDMLFKKNITNTVNLCINPKYRKEFIKKLRKAHKENDYDLFNEVIEKGITYVIPCNELGNRKITTMEEAYQAACNFAEYVS